MRFGFNLCRLPLGNCVPVSLVTLRGRKDNDAIRIVDAHLGGREAFCAGGCKANCTSGSESGDSQRIALTLSIGRWQIHARVRFVRDLAEEIPDLFPPGLPVSEGTRSHIHNPNETKINFTICVL